MPAGSLAERRLTELTATPSDINEHLPYLAEVSEGCYSIVELGTRGGVSTTAWMVARPQILITYDLNPAPPFLLELAKDSGVRWTHITESTIEQGVGHACDLLFIDTLHTYAQLKKEFEIFGPHVRHRIVLHDTYTFGLVGEDGTEPGLIAAINEFLWKQPWVVERHTDKCNGLTTLRRA